MSDSGLTFERDEAAQLTRVTVEVPDSVLVAATADDLTRNLEPYWVLIWLEFRKAWKRGNDGR